MKKNQFSQYLPNEVCSLLLKESEELLEKITEIRLRIGQPIIVYSNNNEKLLSYITTGAIIKETVELISGYSLYAWESELRAGFITLPGGCRVGLCGKTVVEDEKVKTMVHISGINMRIKHEVKGCSNAVLKLIPDLGHMVIISPPGCGKTTLLRDLARSISNKGKTVAIVDERSEIAGSYMGVPQNDVGMRTDVLDRCPKDKGMTMLLRSMSPDVIVADEIGSKKDVEAIEQIANAGVKIICTIHGSGIDDIRERKHLKELTGLFDNYIVLSAKSGPGTIEGIYNKNFEEMGLC